jgi:RNA polymerase sigma-70 factor (ECF subfamily)
VDEVAERLWEQTMVLRCQAGDDSAFEDLVTALHSRLSYYVENLGGSPHDVDDVLQEVWLDAYRKLPHLRSPRSFRAWLYRIARDKVFARFRRKKPCMEPYRDQEIPDRATEEPDFSPQDAARIHACFDKISPEHREVLVLRFLEQMTYDEIAAAVGCRIGTVRSRIFYAKRALRRKMEDINDEQ